MTEVGLSAGELPAPRIERLSRSWSLTPRRPWPWEPILVGFGLVAAVAAVWITVHAGFLAYPALLGAQKADFILGPIGVGLYWMHRRPENRLGLMLVVLGLIGVLYILESSSDPTLFRLGVVTEDPLFLLTAIVILAFPSGRLDGLPERVTIGLVVGMLTVTTVLYASHLAPGFTISNCRHVCPGDPASTAAYSPDSWLVRQHVLGVLPIVIGLSTASVIVWRFVTGTPPRRRALAIGAPVALLYVLVEMSYRGIFLFAPDGLGPSARWVQNVLQWGDAAARSLVWYGFLFALIAAELFAARVMRDVFRRSLERPSLQELELLIRDPLGDPRLRLGFWQPGTRGWVASDGAVLQAGPGQSLTTVDRDGRPAVAIVHDVQLSDDPELMQAAGAAALLAQENAELDAAWRQSLRDLAGSRARLTQASDRERRKLERDLHDGAQQRLMSIQVKLRLAQERADPAVAAELAEIGEDAADAVDELRTLAHGIYPPVLRDYGVVDALKAFAVKSAVPVTVDDEGIGRCPRTIEAAIYFCSMEAIQNAIKHAGDGAQVTITVGRDDGHVRFAVADDGIGMNGPRNGDGDGLMSMRDRIGAVGGRLDVTSSPGVGTRVEGTIPVGEAPVTA